MSITAANDGFWEISLLQHCFISLQKRAFICYYIYKSSSRSNKKMMNINLLKDSSWAPADVELLLELNRLQMHKVIHIGDLFSFQHLQLRSKNIRFINS